MDERRVALVVRDEHGAFGLGKTSVGVHLGQAHDLLTIEVGDDDTSGAGVLGVDPVDFAVARALASRGVSVSPGATVLREHAARADAFATAIRDSGEALRVASTSLGTVRGRGDVLSGTTEVRSVEVSGAVEGLDFVALDEVLDRWARGTGLPSPSLAFALSHLGPGSSESLRERGLVVETWEVAKGIRMIPIRTPTIPPATHTNAFLIGNEHLLLVEPASPFEDEIERLVAIVDELRAAGAVLDGILLTHHHPDHVGGAMALRERLSAPVLAHEWTARRLEGRAVIDRLLVDGDRILLAGSPPMELEILHTPGHAPGHLCVYEPRSGALLAGDMVAGVGTILVEPYDGDMRLYLESLERLRAHGSSMILPAHGGVVMDPTQWLSFYVAHRLAREAKIVDALAERGEPSTIAELVPIAYADTSPVAWPLAQMSSAAHLDKLVHEGRARRDGDRFVLTRR